MRFDIFSITTNQVIVAYLLRGFKIMYAISFAFFYLIYYLHSHAYSRNEQGGVPALYVFVLLAF